MLPILTPAQMQQVDRHTIDVVGIPGRVLMEHAGRAVAEPLDRLLPDRGSVGVVCGIGNNGGDGFVAARLLAHVGRRVQIVLCAGPTRLAGDALASYEVARRLGLPISEATSPEPLANVDLGRHDWLLDALLGTGTRGPVRGHYADVIDNMNASRVPILSCDLPSGLDGETGHVEGACVRAQETVTICLPKPGLMLYPGAEFVGRLTIADIGFPREAIEAQSPALFLLERADAAARLPSRPPNAHKGDFGRVLLLCGSRGMTGAAALAATAALRTGTGLVTVGSPASLNDVLEAQLTEAMTAPFPETPEGTLSAAAEGAVRSRARDSDVLGIGPGISQHDEVRALVRDLFADWTDMPTRIVVDADALNASAPLSSSGISFPAGTILTPHPGEAARLLDSTADEVEWDRIGSARRLAAETDAIAVLKGAPTVIAHPEGTAFLNPTGNPGMATAGSGDVLTGILTALLGQGLDPLDAAMLGAYLHGHAGDLAAEEHGAGLIAGDVVREIPRALIDLAAPSTE